MSLGPGSTLGPFKIQSLLGRGGMGEVFSAIDTRLGRKVALKILPRDFAGDVDRLRRFQSEAKVLASLNHPNILVIHEVGTDGTPYLVSELLEGRTLRDELRSGALPLRKSLDYALQIAHGLAAAHARGVIHRDLKPENIFITKDGRVKILDFGLAKLNEVGRGFRRAESRLNTETFGSAVASPHHLPEDLPTLLQSTVPGVILGTPAYMSPEQVRGESADHRSDIFSFGCVLYEMLAGRSPFGRETAVGSMNSVLADEPPEFSPSSHVISGAVDRVVRRCLEKSPERRFQSAADLSFAIEGISGSTTSTPIPASMPRTAVRRLLTAALLLGCVLAAFVFGARMRAPAASSFEPLTWRGERLDATSIASGPQISPDGKELAFVAMINDQSQLGLMIVDSGNWRILTTNRNRGLINVISWSADGETIVYDRIAGGPGGVYCISKMGGEERLVLEGAMHPHVRPDGSILVLRRNASAESQLHLFSPETEQARPLNALPDGGLVSGVALFPDGTSAIFRGRTTNNISSPKIFWRINLNSGVVQPFLTNITASLRFGETWPCAVTRDGTRFVFDMPSGSLHRVFSVLLAGPPKLTPLLTLTSDPLTIDLDSAGNLFINQAERPNEIVRRSLAGDRLIDERIPLSPSSENRPVLPLPGNRFLFSSSTRGAPRLMLMEPGKETRPFLDSKIESSPPFSWLGTNEILFSVREESRFVLAAASLQGRGLRRIHKVDWSTFLEKSAAGSPDGSMIYYAEAGFVYSIPASGGNPRKLCPGHSIAVHPDGRSLIVKVNGPAEIYLVRYSLLDQTQERVAHDAKDVFTTSPLAANAVAPDGRILVQIAPLDSWYWPAVIINPHSGVSTLTTERQVDMVAPGWDSEGRMVASEMLFRSSIWRFRPAIKESP